MPEKKGHNREKNYIQNEKRYSSTLTTSFFIYALRIIFKS